MCKKDSTTAADTGGSFSVDGVSYKSGSQGTHYSASAQMLYCTNDNKDSLTISFLARPTATKAYAVMNDDADTLNSSNCGVDCLIGGGLIHDYYSLGTSGDSVYVTVSSTGKITASFTNITLTDTAFLVQASGLLKEQ